MPNWLACAHTLTGLEEGLYQQLVEAEVPGVAELLEAERHVFVTFRRLIAVGSRGSPTRVG